MELYEAKCVQVLEEKVLFKVEIVRHKTELKIMVKYRTRNRTKILMTYSYESIVK